jgi:hypothetical protein
MRTDLFTVSGALPHNPAVAAWFEQHNGELGDLARRWFAVMRNCGDEVCETVHDGCPVACLGDAPFAYVNVFAAHMNVGFFHGNALPDPGRLLQGSGKFMRHIKLKASASANPAAVEKLITAAYADIKNRVENG